MAPVQNPKSAGRSKRTFAGVFPSAVTGVPAQMAVAESALTTAMSRFPVAARLIRFGVVAWLTARANAGGMTAAGASVLTSALGMNRVGAET